PTRRASDLGPPRRAGAARQGAERTAGAGAVAAGPGRRRRPCGQRGQQVGGRPPAGRRRGGPAAAGPGGTLPHGPPRRPPGPLDGLEPFSGRRRPPATTGTTETTGT